MLDYKFQHELTVLQKSPFWFEIGAIDGTTQTCDIKRINIHSFVDVNLIFQEFKEGVLDYFDFFVDDEWREEIQADSRYELLSYPRDYMYFLAFNLDRPYIGGEDNNIWLDEPGKTDYTKALAVRKAICNAINLTHINKKFLDNEYLRNHNPNPYINDFIGLPFPIQYDGNLSVAKEWMEAAGYSFDIITLKANSNIVIAVLCVVLISIFIDKIKLKRIKIRQSLPFSELILSWNASRPQKGKFVFWVNIKHKNWSGWRKIAEWGKDGQKTFIHRHAYLSPLPAIQYKEDLDKIASSPLQN